MGAAASVTKRERKRQLKSGAVILQTRYVVNFQEPETGQRKQFFYKRHRDAVAKRDELLSSVVTGSYSAAKSELRVSQAVEHWLENRRTQVKPGTLRSYQQAVGYIIGPLLVGTKLQRHAFARTGVKPVSGEFIEMLGLRPVAELTTADIRQWHTTLTAQVSAYTANVAKKFLRAALALAAEDFNLRVPSMPSHLGRGRAKPKKGIITPVEVSRLLRAALQDEHKGIYYAFPFLTGVRPSEQLALLWDDIDFEAGRIRIQRMQEQDGSVTEFTKTAAGTRDIPMSAVLSDMLMKWRAICPRSSAGLHRVFPRLGRLPSAPGQPLGGGGVLSYANFRKSYWQPAFAVLGLPYVTPHSARHTFISTLQAQGIEVGLVAKLAGHANANVTLGHYTQAVRGGEVAVAALEGAYFAPAAASRQQAAAGAAAPVEQAVPRLAAGAQDGPGEASLPSAATPAQEAPEAPGAPDEAR
jgi:integrase